MKICQYCGQSNLDNAKFCTECGATLPAAAQAVPAAAVAAAPAAPAAPAPEAAPAAVPETPPAAVPETAPVPVPGLFPSADAEPVSPAAPGAYPAGPSAGYAQAPSAAGSRAATKQEFLELPQNARLKKDLKSTAIICYICAAVTLLIFCLVIKNPIGILDVLVLVGLGLGIQLKQSKVCAIILLAYAAVSAISGLINNGRLSGYLVILAGIYAVKTTFAIDKQWKEYCQTTSV